MTYKPTFKSTYRGTTTKGNMERIATWYKKLGDDCERDDDYRGKHDYWQHAEFWSKKE